MYYKIRNLYSHEPKVLIIYDEGVVYEIHEDDPEYTELLNDLMNQRFSDVRNRLTSDLENGTWGESG